MTAIRLRNELNKLIAKGWGRSKVCVNKPTFAHNCEGDGCVILDVEQVILEVDPRNVPAIRAYEAVGFRHGRGQTMRLRRASR